MYSVTMKDVVGISESSQAQAVGAFRQGLESALGGGAAKVAIAHMGYVNALSRHGGEPLPMGASADDRNAVDRWNDALAAAKEAAFLGWVRPPVSAAFVVRAVQ